MTQDKLHCENCLEETEQKRVGFMPMKLLILPEKEDQHGDEWVNVAVCKDCGNVNTLDISLEELEQAEERYVRTLLDMELVTEREAQDVLQQHDTR